MNFLDTVFRGEPRIHVAEPNYFGNVLWTYGDDVLLVV